MIANTRCFSYWKQSPSILSAQFR